MKQYILFRLITLFTLALSTVTGLALDLSHYASESVLSEGRWVKISVDESGMHRIPAATLRKWGFSDPAAVRIYGYGGQRIADALTEQNYIDDLPLVKSVSSSDGSVVFYAVGPHTWEGDNMSVRRSNPYSTKGYYFVTENSAEIPALPKPVLPEQATLRQLSQRDFSTNKILFRRANAGNCLSVKTSAILRRVASTSNCRVSAVR